ncbi:zf-DHHC-domain-containing protein [Aaosphaeria arxii CBS 175.79]|uniref:Palmitoyltransferase PFA4 n=1 Tax=Aaosphaeria arxii CBS 175.79 TaxID=1450172 RepID=A0A6A5XIT3_9PLEO|nr:zf-DHHC-domain-containing protein [Aaosphaeria arxii CBS 175.79]KAF2013168.1 zf-DHHC-domain-containing protein [Aaosphaeria arxii CBS 175.79]
MELGRFAVPSVYALIFFLAYTSQWLLLYLEPFPPTKNQLVWFNSLLVCLLISYTKSVFVDPGRIPKIESEQEETKTLDGTHENKAIQSRKWCRKCKAIKPPRAHHCRECQRCIPKMDHHCPWTQNCVSHTTFPHFMRFLFYAVVSMTYLFNLIWAPASHLWAERHLPSYLGPSIYQLAHLFAILIANSLTLFALTILLIRNIWGLSVNTTTIEGWEIERHSTLVRRAKYFGGWLDGPDGVKVQIRKQEFPYDIGIWKNIKQGMGTGNVLAWFWPFASTPSIEGGLKFETNGFEDESLSWPPPDPDRMYRKQAPIGKGETAFTYRDAGLTPEETLAAFRKRQENDIVRRREPFVNRVEDYVARQRSLDNSEEVDSGEETDTRDSEERAWTAKDSQDGEEGWRNREGERLRDFGLDEEVEFYDEEDDLPLSELLARKRQAA